MLKGLSSHLQNINPYDRPWYSEQDAAVAAAAAAAKAKGRVQAAPLKGKLTKYTQYYILHGCKHVSIVENNGLQS